MPIFIVPRDEWPSFCREFSQKHEGEPITIELLSGSEEDSSTERTTVARDCPLHSLRIEKNGGEDLLILLGLQTRESGPQFVVAPRQLRLEQPDADEPGRLRIDTADGQIILINLPVPVLPGMLNGV